MILQAGASVIMPCLRSLEHAQPFYGTNTCVEGRRGAFQEPTKQMLGWQHEEKSRRIETVPGQDAQRGLQRERHMLRRILVHLWFGYCVGKNPEAPQKDEKIPMTSADLVYTAENESGAVLLELGSNIVMVDGEANLIRVIAYVVQLCLRTSTNTHATARLRGRQKLVQTNTLSRRVTWAR